MDWERLAAIAKSRNLYGKDALKFFEECARERDNEWKESQLQIEKERERAREEHERTVARLKEQIYEAKQKLMLMHRRREISCLDLTVVRSAESSESEGEASQLQEVETIQEVVALGPEQVDENTVRPEEIYLGPDEQTDVGARNWLSEVGTENASSVKDRHEGSAGCCKPSFNRICTDACPTVEDAKQSHDPRDDHAELGSEHGKVGVYNEREVKKNESLGDEPEKLEDEYSEKTASSESGENEITLGSSGSEYVPGDEKAVVEAANEGLCCKTRERTRARERRKRRKPRRRPREESKRARESGPATLIHMVWTCTRYNTNNTNTLESWESLLRVSEPADQRRLIQRAVEAAVSQGIPADLL